MIDDTVCKNIIRDIGRKYKIDPRLITTKLMSEEDKNDLRGGNLPVPALDLHVKIWIARGMPDYVTTLVEQEIT